MEIIYSEGSNESKHFELLSFLSSFTPPPPLFFLCFSAFPCSNTIKTWFNFLTHMCFYVSYYTRSEIYQRGPVGGLGLIFGSAPLK